MKIISAIKNFKWGYLLFAILFAGGGLCFLAFPENALEYVRKTIGIVCVVFAGIFVALTLAERARGFRFWAKMVLAVFAMVCSGVMIFAGDGPFSYLVCVAGIYMMIDGSFKLQTAILSKRFKSAFWWVMLFLTTAAIAMGVALIRTQFDFSTEMLKVSRFLGAGLMLDGLLNLLSIGYLYRIEKGTRKEVEDELRAEGKLITVEDAVPALAPEKADATEKKKQLKKDRKHAALQEEKTTFTVPTTTEDAVEIPLAEEETREIMVQFADDSGTEETTEENSR